MIKITKNEAEYMRKEGYADFVKHSFSKHKTYYLVEEQNDIYKYDPKKGRRVLIRLGALNKLKQYRTVKGQTD